MQLIYTSAWATMHQVFWACLTTTASENKLVAKWMHQGPDHSSLGAPSGSLKPLDYGWWLGDLVWMVYSGVKVHYILNVVCSLNHLICQLRRLLG